MGLIFSKTQGLFMSDEQLLIAIFTDGPENASTDYTALAVQKKLTNPK